MKFELEFDVAARPERVLACLTEPELLVATHPLITALEPDGEGYRVGETVRLAGWPYRFSYPATIELDRVAGVVRMNAAVRSTTEIRMVFAVEARGEGTVVREEVEITAPWGARRLLRRVLRRAHAKWFRAMAEGAAREVRG